MHRSRPGPTLRDGRCGAGLGTDGDRAGLPEHPETLRHDGVAHIESLRELAERALAGAEGFDDFASGRAGKGNKTAQGYDNKYLLN